MRMYVIAAALLGVIGVACGAFGAHGLKPWLSVTELASWKTAVQYQMIHGLCLLAIVALYRQDKRQPLDKAYYPQAGLLILIGTLLFSGSLYLLLLTKWQFLGPVTPLGGLLLMAGWLRLLIGVVKDKS